MTIARRKIAAPAAAPAPHNGFSLISNQKLLQIYSAMLQCRMIEARIRALIKQNQLDKHYDTTGQEAAFVGAAIDLLPEDTLAPYHRALIPCFLKGLPLSTLFALLAPVPTRARLPFTCRNLISPALSPAVQLDRAIDAAIANKAAKNSKIVVAFCGDSSELLYPAFSRAGAQDLPILFVCHTAANAEQIAARAQEYGFPGIAVDAQDAVAVYRVATEAMAHARRGSGPTLIECIPWPLSGPRKGQPRKSEVALVNMENYLVRKRLFTAELKSQATSAFKRELAAAL